MDPIEWLMEYDSCGGWMRMDEFIVKHGAHTILICDEGPTSGDELVQMFGEKAEVEYLGEDSPHYLENSGLYFVIRPLTKKGTPRRRGGTHVVVYPFPE